MKKESYYIKLNDTDELHIRRFSKDKPGSVVLMIHGAIENGRIFYSNSDRGLAPYLAKQGFDVFVPDLRGRGKSRPPVHSDSSYGQTEAITEDIPAIINFIKQERGDIPMHWITHSWGGVLTSSFLARFPEYIPKIKSMVYFAVKRSVHAKTWKRFLKVDLAWKFLGSLIVAAKGYMPARELGFGADNESKKFYHQSIAWLGAKPWIDPEDGFDYGAALQKLTLPPTLYFAAKGDKALGHPQDVQILIKESGDHIADFVLLSIDNGHSNDYDHISILTHPQAVEEQYKMTLDWLKKYDKS